MEIGDVEIMGAFEIQARLRVSKHRAYVLINRHDFPRERWQLASGRVWWRSDVEAWIAANRPELADGPPTDEV